MRWIEVLAFIHILLGVIWVGGTIHTEAMQRHADRSDDPSQIVERYLSSGFVNRRLFLVPSWGVILTGVWLALATARLDDGWVVWAFLLSLFAAFFGVLMLTRRGRRLAQRVSRDGVTPEILEEVRVLSRYRMYHTSVLLVVLALMVFKPL